MKLKPGVAVVAVLAYIALVPTAALAALDPSFSGDGKLVIDLHGRISDVMESGDKIVAVGSSDNGMAVIRLSAAGVPDPSFGGDTDGVLLTNNHGLVVGVGPRPGGGYWLGGSSSGDFALVAVTSAGQVDTTFGGGDGMETVDLGGAVTATATAMSVDPSGRILVAGLSSDNDQAHDLAVGRFTSEGAPDATFGTGGGVLLDAGSVSESASDVGTTPSGQPVLVGGSSQSSAQIVVARLKTNGDPDPGFGGGDGLVLTGVGNNSGAQAVQVLANGDIVVGATTWKSGAFADWPTFNFVVMRLTTDGTVDTTFGTGGSSITDFGGRDDLADIAVMSDGSIIAVGSVEATGDSDFGLVRYNEAGMYDPVFGKQRTHFFTDQFGNRSGDAPEAVALLSDGRVIVGGITDANLFPVTGERMALALYTKPLPACTIIGAPGSDTLTGTAGRDVVCGVDGNDVLKGMGGNDILLGGAGDDILKPGPGADQNLGGPGADTVTFDVTGTGVTANLSTGSARGQGADTLAEVEHLYGTDRADSLSGSAGADVLKGFGGNDVLKGLTGNDTLNGGPGNDVLNGGPGKDTCVPGGGSDTRLSCEG